MKRVLAVALLSSAHAPPPPFTSPPLRILGSSHRAVPLTHGLTEACLQYTQTIPSLKSRPLDFPPPKEPSPTPALAESLHTPLTSHAHPRQDAHSKPRHRPSPFGLPGLPDSGPGPGRLTQLAVTKHGLFCEAVPVGFILKGYENNPALTPHYFFLGKEGILFLMRMTSISLKLLF